MRFFLNRRRRCTILNGYTAHRLHRIKGPPWPRSRMVVLMKQGVSEHFRRCHQTPSPRRTIRITGRRDCWRRTPQHAPQARLHPGMVSIGAFHIQLPLKSLQHRLSSLHHSPLKTMLPQHVAPTHRREDRSFFPHETPSRNPNLSQCDVGRLSLPPTMLNLDPYLMITKVPVMLDRTGISNPRVSRSLHEITQLRADQKLVLSWRRISHSHIPSRISRSKLELLRRLFLMRMMPRLRPTPLCAG